MNVILLEVVLLKVYVKKILRDRGINNIDVVSYGIREDSCSKNINYVLSDTLYYLGYPRIKLKPKKLKENSLKFNKDDDVFLLFLEKRLNHPEHYYNPTLNKFANFGFKFFYVKDFYGDNVFDRTGSLDKFHQKALRKYVSTGKFRTGFFGIGSEKNEVAEILHNYYLELITKKLVIIAKDFIDREIMLKLN